MQIVSRAAALRLPVSH